MSIESAKGALYGVRARNSGLRRISVLAVKPAGLVIHFSCTSRCTNQAMKRLAISTRSGAILVEMLRP